MADTKITALTAISTVDPATDVFPIVDTSDTTMAASGTTKKITSNQILGAGGTATLASATITGDLTVRTNKLKVDSNGVAVGTTTSSTGGGVMCVEHTSNNGLVINSAGGSPTLYLRNTADSSNAKIMFTNAVNLDFANVSGTLATLTTGGNLGLGVTPSYKLHVVRSTDGITAGFAGQSYGIRFDNGGAFSTGGSTIHGVDQTLSSSYQPLGLNGSLLTFSTGATERARFNGTGAFVLAGGNTSANGIGIAFPATQAASSDANTLDDYEEGTFTPVVIGATSAGVGTYTTQVGYYTKVGNLVTIRASINWTAHTGTGVMRIGGLPFSVNSPTSATSAVTFGYVDNVALTAGNILTAFAFSGTTFAECWQTPSGGGAASPVPIDTSAIIIYSFTYSV